MCESLLYRRISLRFLGVCFEVVPKVDVIAMRLAARQHEVKVVVGQPRQHAERLAPRDSQITLMRVSETLQGGNCQRHRRLVWYDDINVDDRLRCQADHGGATHMHDRRCVGQGRQEACCDRLEVMGPLGIPGDYYGWREHGQTVAGSQGMAFASQGPRGDPPPPPRERPRCRRARIRAQHADLPATKADDRLAAMAEAVDPRELVEVVQAFGATWTEAAADMETYLRSQVADDSHREVVGPLLAASGASGVVRVGGAEAATWGNPDSVEMTFSVTKSVVSLVAGLAFDDGLLLPDEPVSRSVSAPEFTGPHNSQITWRHLLQQTSQWEGTLWGKPTAADAQSFREGTEVHGTPPGQGWAYNDVRMNLLTYALTLLFQSNLGVVLEQRVMNPIGASNTWSWNGYSTSVVSLPSGPVTAVSGGAHWGGGLFISARDLALIGEVFLNEGRFDEQTIVSAEWVRQSWTPCPVKPEYGYLWWLNDTEKPWPGAPRTGRSARGNAGRHLLWVDPARELVLTSHWTEHPAEFIRAISALVPVDGGDSRSS